MFSHTKTTLMIILTAISLAVPAHAQKKDATAQPQSPDKLDVSDLEKKYWAAKDTDFSVVQNRTYAKEKRFALSLQYGTMVNDAYSTGPTYSGAVNYYFTERHGVEVSYFAADLKDSKATENYKTLTNGVMPNHNKVTGYYGVAYNWVPIYAKVSLLNKKIIYFDMAVSPGFGMLSYEQQLDPNCSLSDCSNRKKTTTAVSLDVTQSFFISRHVALRFDYKNKWYKEEIIKSGNVGVGSVLENTSATATSLMFGVQLFW